MLTPALYLFAKAPVPGTVKTRLQPPLDAEHAARVAAGLLTRSASHAAAWWPGPVALCCAPDAGHPLFTELARGLHLGLLDQGEGDLGTRMHRALAAGIAGHGAAAVLGTDVPHLPGNVLELAFERLARRQEVIGPALDGGYYLIGLAAPCPALFDAIAWGTGQVLTQTRERALAQGRTLLELPACQDIDTWEDLVAAATSNDYLASLVADFRPKK